MDRYGRRLRALPVTLVVSGVFCLGASTAIAGPAAPSEGVQPPPVQSPDGLKKSPDSDAPAPPAAESAEETVSAPTASEGAEPPAGDESTVPEAGPPAATAPAEASAEPASEEADTASPAAQPDPPAEDPKIAPDLLGSEDEAPVVTPKRPPTLRPQVQDPGAREAALRRAYEARVRPENNPGRLNLGARLLFANAGGPKDIGGRLGGAQIDVGQSFNNFGYALTASAWGGRVFLPRETAAEMNALFGAGPTVNLGRRALLHNGYLDLRLGYDFMYGVVNRRRSNAAVVAPQNDPDGDLALEQAENLIPHGPRVNLNMGLLAPQNYRKFIHGFGVTVGYQGLVHSFRGDLPFTHMLTMGLSYWMG